MKRLTKEDVLEGTRRRANLQVKQYGRDVIVRPLSDEEITHILSRISVPAGNDGSPNNSVVDLQKNFEALRLAVSMGMVEPQLTYEEVSKMKFGVPEYIGAYILQLSGVTSSDAAKKKRAEIREFVRSPEGFELACLCIDFHYKLSDNPGSLTRDQITFLTESLRARSEAAEIAHLADQGITKIIFQDES